ncbi:MAG: PH domain-containing protein [Flavobacterium circumlabens]|uniref:PH domain-containing protein n=1 Tax=Flavobacterium circumlabens TaxID=2133765 RepID=UPI003266726C
MEFNTAHELQEHLDHNENLIWTGKPKKGIIFRPSDIFLIPFSILWCSFAIFWFTTALTSGAPFFFALFGIVFVILGLNFVFGRFIIDAKHRANTIYGLTEHRVIIKSGIFTSSIKSLNIKTISDIQYEEKIDGSGTITIGPRNPMDNWGSGINWESRKTPSLEFIPDVRKVYNKITEIQRS